MYYVIEETYEDEYYTDAVVENIQEILDYKVSLPEKLGNNFPRLMVKVISKNKPTDFFMSGPILIVSKELKDIFDRFNSKIEYFPVSLIHKKTTYENSFYFAHVLCDMDFIDKEKSIYTMDRGYFDEIEKLVINEDILNNEPIVILTKSFLRVLIINEELFKEINKLSITGINFSTTY